MKRLFAGTLCALLVGTELHGQVSSPAAQEVFAAESSFAAAFARRDTAAFASFVASEAIFFGGATPARGRAAVLASWASLLAAPSPPFSWHPETIEVLASGTLALSSGPVLSASGVRTGTFDSIWRKEADGTWRVVFDKGCRCP
jgi:ketosteroid isomerase-like protein